MVAAPTRARPQYAPMELLQPLSPLWATRLHIAKAEIEAARPKGAVVRSRKAIHAMETKGFG